MKWPFDKPESLSINRARLEHLAGLGLGLENKRVLEVGTGIGLLTSFWEDRGCGVVSTDARPRNIAENLRRYPWRNVKLLNLDGLGSHDHLGKFDIVFMYGTLYHLSRPLVALRSLARLCEDLFLLSTCVHPCDNGEINKCHDGWTNSADQGLVVEACCRPARDLIMQELREGCGHAYHTVTQPKHHDYPLQWPIPRPYTGLVRAVFVGSRSPLCLPTLSESLLMNQDYYQETC